MMLTITGMQQLGKVPNPQTGAMAEDLFQAKQTIDLMQILMEKTKNNLTKEEEDFFKSSMTNLRLSYAEAANKKR